jgi:HK97 family phage prohead protease
MRLEIKEISPEGSFEGLLSPYGNVDGGGDVVEPGAYTKTLQEHGNKVPLLWQHKTDTPVGDLTLEDRPDGLWCKGQLLMALGDAVKAHLLIKARIVKGLSIGFETVKDSVEKGIRHLKEIRLYEGSIVTFPMNEAAMITSVKGSKDAKGDFNEELAEQQLFDAADQMRYALGCALSSVVWSDLKRDEKITATEVIIQQFSDAYLAYIPVYLDMLTEMFGGMETWSTSAKFLEFKAGRMISAANEKTIQTHCGNIKDSADALLALVASAATDTSKEAVIPEAKAADPKPEPVPDHSAAHSLIGNIRSLIPA